VAQCAGSPNSSVMHGTIKLENQRLRLNQGTDHMVVEQQGLLFVQRIDNVKIKKEFGTSLEEIMKPKYLRKRQEI